MWKACLVYVLAGPSRLVLLWCVMNHFDGGGLFLVWTACHAYMVAGASRLVLHWCVILTWRLDASLDSLEGMLCLRGGRL